jgi:hypothetical protein
MVRIIQLREIQKGKLNNEGDTIDLHAADYRNGRYWT